MSWTDPLDELCERVAKRYGLERDEAFDALVQEATNFAVGADYLGIEQYLEQLIIMRREA